MGSRGHTRNSNTHKYTAGNIGVVSGFSSPRISSIDAMRDNEGYEIRHNGVPMPRASSKAATRPTIIEIVDRSTGAKLVMLAGTHQLSRARDPELGECALTNVANGSSGPAAAA
jgi:hypothetical protein